MSKLAVEAPRNLEDAEPSTQAESLSRSSIPRPIIPRSMRLISTFVMKKKADGNGKSKLNIIPNELILEIAKHLSVEAVVNLANTCCRTRHLLALDYELSTFPADKRFKLAFGSLLPSHVINKTHMKARTSGETHALLWFWPNREFAGCNLLARRDTKPIRARNQRIGDILVMGHRKEKGPEAYELYGKTFWRDLAMPMFWKIMEAEETTKRMIWRWYFKALMGPVPTMMAGCRLGWCGMVWVSMR